MSVYERYQRMKADGSYSSNNSSSSVYERYRKMRIEDAFSTTDFSNPNSLEYWIGAANNFVNDLDDYYSNNSQKYDVNFGSSFDNQFESAFRTGEAALKYLEKNKDTIHGYYDLKKGIQSYLDAFNTAKESVSGVRDYYSQWGTEDDYNAYTEAQNLLNPTTFASDDVDGRNARIKEIDARLDELRAGYVNDYTLGEDPWISNHTSIIDNGKASDVISEEQKLIKEKKSLENANRQYKRTQEWADENAKIMQNEDFAEDSQKRNFTNPTRQELSEYDTRMSGGFTPDENNVLYDVYGDVFDDTYYDRFKAPEVTDKLGLYLSSSEEDIEDAYNSDAYFQEQTWANLIKEGDAQSWKQLKPEEIGIYYYFLNNGGQEQAYQWLDGMTTELNRREMEKTSENIQKSYDEASTLKKIGMSAASIPASVFGGALSFVSDLGYYLRGEELNPYDTAHAFQDYAQTVRSATAEDINERTNNANLLGFTWGDAYQSIMSAGDSALGFALGSGTYGVLMGMGAASSKARELYEKGASMEEIAWGGVLAGAAEMVFEKYSIDKLVDLKDAKTLGQVVKNLLSQGGVEASEEAFTEIANTITDGIILGGQSDLNKKAVEEYMSQGMSLAKAQALALASNVWKAGMGGFISGALMGGGASATQAIANRSNVKTEGDAIIKSGGVDALKELALEVAGAPKGSDSRYTKRLAEATDKKQSARNVGLLSSAVTDLVATQNVADIEKTLQENGMSKKEAKETAQYLKAASEGEVLTEEQQKALMDNKVVSKVYGDIIMDSNSTYNKRRQTLMDIGTMEEGFAGVDTKALEESQTPESITKNIANRIAQERAIEQAVKNGMKKPSDELLSQIEGIKEAQSSVIPERNFKDVGQLDTARMNEALKGAKVANVDGKVTDNGATFRKSTGEEVSIKKIASIDAKHKTMELELEDGTKVDSRDISYGDRNQALLYESVLMMGYDAHTANAIIQGYDANGTVSVSDYLIGTNEAFNYGWGHIPEKARGGAGYKALTKSQREHAVKIGEDARAADDKQRKANMPNKQNALAKKNRTYGATLEVDKDYIPDRAKASIEGLDVIGKKLNLRFIIKDLNGKSNGYYKESEDVIIVDINAGRNGQHTLLWTASHELGHRLRAWNVDKFNTLADFLMERYAEKGVDIDELIRIEQEKAIKASKGKDKLTYDEAYEEVVCQALQGFLTDSNFIAELNELQKKDATLAEKLISFLKDILDKIRNAYKGLSPSDKAAEYLKEMNDTADKLYKMLSEGLMETADTVTKGDANAAITLESDGTIKAQLKQYDDTGRDALYNYMKDNYSEKEADELIGTVDLIANTVRDLKNDKSLSVFGNWQEQEVELDEEGHPIFTTNITNGDYSLNQDFSRVCKKRRQLDFVLNMLAEDPAFEASNLTKEDFVAINNAIKEHGFEIACALCFVDAKRFRQAEWADSYANTYNDILQSVTKQKLTPFNFATKSPNMADDNIEIDLNAPVSFRKWSDGKVTSTRKYKNLNELIAKEGNNQVKAIARMIKNNPNYRHLFRGADIVASQGFDSIQRLAPDIRQTLDGWGGTSVPKPSSSDAIYDNSILNIAGYNADSAFAVGGVRMNSFSDFMGHMFFDYVQAFADLTAKKLPMQSYTKELDFARLFGLTGGKINMSLIAKIREGALSLDGLSETSTKYKNIKAAEQRVAGLDITKLTERLGKSVMELTDEDILNNLDLVDYLWADESIDYKKAVLLQSGILYDNLTDEQIDKCVDLIRKKEIKQAHKVAGAENVDTRYAKNIGTICVGVSDAHILKLLRDDTIRMVIPYHKSGLNGAIAKALNIAYYVDYSSSQTTGLCILQDDGTYASRIGLNGASAAEKGYKIKDFSFYDYFGKTIDGVTYDAKKTAAKYKEWCEYGVYDEEAGCNVYYLKSGGYITAEELHKTAKIVPKFEQFSNEENYYKVLEDFDCYDTLTGEHSQQNAVEMNLPSDYKSVLKSSLSAEQQVSDDFKHHLDHEGLRDEIMNIVKKNGYVPSEGVKNQYKEENSEEYSYSSYGNDFYKNSKIYSYDFLVHQDAMKKLNLLPLSDIYTDGRIDRERIIKEGKKNALQQEGSKQGPNGTVYVVNKYTNKSIEINTKSIRHGLGGNRNFLITNSRMGLIIGDIVRNGIPINELTPSEGADATYAMVAYAVSPENKEFIAIAHIDVTTGELMGFESIDTVHSLRGRIKKGSTAAIKSAQGLSNDKLPFVTSDISIAELLEIVNSVQQSILSDDVLKHFNEERSEEGYYYGQVLHQYKDEDSLDSRNLLANALITTAKVGEERNLLRNYQSKINLINAEEQKLTEIRKKLFTKNAVDSEERKKLQHEAKAIATRINKYDKELLKLESMAPMKKVLQKEKDLATKRQKQKDAEAMREYKETMENKQREISQRWMENRSKAVESRNKTELRHKIRKTVKELDTVLKNGRKKRNVKVGLRSAVEQAISTAEVLFSPMSNEDIYNAGPITAVTAKEKSMLAEYGELTAKASSLKDKMESLKTQEGTWNEYLQLDTELEQINESIKKLNRDLKDVFTRERNRLQELPISEAIQQLADAYKEVSQSKEKHISEAYDDIVYQMLITMKEKLGGATIYDMSPEQLKMVYDAYRLILHTISTSNKLFREGKLEELSTNAENVMSEVKAIKKSKDERIAIFDEANTATWNELKPIYAFDRIGSETLSKLYKDLRKGQDSWGRDIDEAAQFIEKIRNKYDYNSWNIKERYAVELVTGKKVELTLPQMMSIYAYSKRDQAKDHMEKGGFVFNNKETFKKEKKLLKYIATQSEAFRIGEEDVANIKSLMGDKAVNYVDEMQAYLTDVMGVKGNEVSKQLFGIELFKEAIYFPLKSAKDFIFEANTPAGEIALKNAGMTKETTPHASNPIVLENFDDVWANHVNKMSLYHSLVVPIDNMNKVFNYTDYALSDDSNSVQTTLRAAYGNGVNEYIQKLLQDINGGITSDKVKSPLAGLVGTFKKTAVAASLSVVVQQPTAVVRAMSMVDLKYFIPDKSLKHSEKWEQLKKYAPVAVIKEIGGFDAGSGRQAAQYLTATEYKGLKQKAKAMFTDSNFRDEVFMSGAGFADELGWNLIWDACKREVKATTNLKGEELLKKAGERFTEVVDYTQVYDSSLSRSGYMRSQSDIVKMATSFMGEPTTSFNMIYNTVLQAKRKNISGWKAARTVGATVASIVLGAAFKSAIGAGRDDDEDESYTEKYFQALGSNLSSDIWIWNWLPFVKDIVSIFEGWDIERTDMALVADLKQAIDGFSSDSKSTWKKYEDLIGTIGNFFGVPVKNILRDGRSMVNIFKGIFDDIKPQNVRESLREGWTGKETTIISSLDSNNTERAKELIEDKIAGYIADGKTEKEAKSYVRSSLTSEYKERYLEAYAKKDNDELIRIRKLLHSTGVYDNVVETCQNWVKDSKK